MTLYVPGTNGYRAMIDGVIESLRPGAKPADPMNGLKTEHAGVKFRSRLEASWAVTFDHYGIKWEYEEELVELESGVKYLPDFRLPDLATVMEVKGLHMQRVSKVREYAREVFPDTIVLIGWPDLHQRPSPGVEVRYMQFSDGLPSSLNAVFTACTSCGAYQWSRMPSVWQYRVPPGVVVPCRICGGPLGKTVFSSGEAPFYDWRDEPYTPPGRG